MAEAGLAIVGARPWRRLFLVGLLLGVLPSQGVADPGTGRAIGALGRISPRHGVIRVAGPPREAVVIERLLVEEGDRVERGQDPAVLQGVELVKARVTRCQAELAQAERVVKRSEGLTRGGAAAEVQLEEAQLRWKLALESR